MKNLLGLLLSTLLLFTPALAAEPPSPQRMDPPLTPGPFKAGEILVKFKGGISPAALASLLAANGLHSKGRLKGVNIDILAVPEGQELAAIAALRANPAVQFAEPNYLFYERPLQGLLRAEAKPIVPGGQGVRATVPETPTPTPTATPCAVEPDDPFYTPRYQWNLNNTGDVGTEDADIDAPEAWCVTTGSEGVVIALIDSGVDLQHPDLRDRIWVNLGEIADNGLDDDNNGYVDDVHGFDFADSQDRNDDGDYNDPGEVSDADPSDDNGLGTWAAGIAAAATNNGEGIAGVSWGAKVMPVRVMKLFETPDGPMVGAYLDDIIRGIEYAADNGARIIYMGFALGPQTSFETVEALQEAVTHAYEKGCLVVAKAGDWAENGNPKIYPAALNHVVAVAATDWNDERASFSSHGPWVDVAAPGIYILSTAWDPWRGSYYYQDTEGRTSWAAAHVAGVAALVWSVNPTLSPDKVENIIEATADAVGEYPYEDCREIEVDALRIKCRNNYYGYGRVNAEAAVKATPHYLQIAPPSLVFLAGEDGYVSAPCYTLTNVGTNASTWTATATTDWLSLDGPYDTMPHYLPSSLTVCADKDALSPDNTYTSIITVTSTMSYAVNNSLPVTVTFGYASRIWRAYLGMLTRDLNSP